MTPLLLIRIESLPVAYRCVFETIDSHGERSAARANGLLDHFERVYGIDPADPVAAHHRECLLAACKRRFFDWQE